MVTQNKDVSNRITNRMTAVFEKIILKEGKSPHKIKCNGYWMWAVNAKDVDQLEASWLTNSAFQG